MYSLVYWVKGCFVHPTKGTGDIFNGKDMGSVSQLLDSHVNSTAKARKSRRFSVSTLCHSGGMYQRHAMPLLLYPPIPHWQASDHSVTVGVVNTMLFIGTPVYATNWRIFIQSCRSSLCQDWRRCGPHFFSLFRRLRSWFRNYFAGVMMLATWLILPTRDYILSVFIFVNARDSLMLCSQAVSFSCGRNKRTGLDVPSQKSLALGKLNFYRDFAEWEEVISFQGLVRILRSEYSVDDQ